jgi:hypothetical protein
MNDNDLKPFILIPNSICNYKSNCFKISISPLTECASDNQFDVEIVARNEQHESKENVNFANYRNAIKGISKIELDKMKVLKINSFNGFLFLRYFQLNY